MNRRQIQAVAGVTAAVGLAISVVTGGSEAPAVALKVYSYGTSIAVALFLTYEHALWHWPIVRRLNRIPDLRGTWRGELRSSFLRDGKLLDPIPTILRIKQTASTQLITLFTGESSSVTEQSRLVRTPDDRWVLTWTYSNTPRPAVRHRSDCHFGTAEVTYDEHSGLNGSYYTDRLTRGELELHEHSQTVYSSVQTADRAADTFRRLN